MMRTGMVAVAVGVGAIAMGALGRAAAEGLIAGGVLGGPLARYLITRNRLAPAAGPSLMVGSTYSEESRLKLDATGVLNAVCVTVEISRIAGR